MRTISCTSGAPCGNTTASGGWFSIQVVVLACCSRTAADVTTRLPKAALSSAMASAGLSFRLAAMPGAMSSSLADQKCRRNVADAVGQVNGAPFVAARRADARRSGFSPQRDEHRHALLIVPVFFAEQFGQVALLQEDAEEDVSSGDAGE